MRLFPTVFTALEIPEDFQLYSQKKKTSERLSMQAMQIAERLFNTKIVNLILTETDQCTSM